jgi:hypothetical protein
MDLPILAFVRDRGLLNTEEGRWSQFEDVWYRTVEGREHWITVAIRFVGDAMPLNEIMDLGTITEAAPGPVTYGPGFSPRLHLEG